MSVPASINGRPATVPSDGRIKCPHCGRPATTEDKVFLQGPDGPVQRVKIGCPAGHWLIPQSKAGESRWAGP